MWLALLAFIWVVVLAVMVVVSIPAGALTYAALACCLLFVRWALAGTVPRSRLAEREANWVPGPVDLDEKRARKLADLTEPDSDPLPGRPNGALNWFYRDKVDAAEMEDMLDRRCGLGKYATTPDWPTDRCAECGTTEDLATHDVTVHPPLCPKCADLWYPAVSDVGETDWLGP